MRITKAIFTKQVKDLLKNPMILVMFIIFPAVALIMTNLIKVEGLPPNLFVTMMAAIFSGMGLIISSSDIISEDIERKSLRFLIIAGVKPHQYIIGTGGSFLLAGTIASILFTLIGVFTMMEAIKFLIIMIAGTATSILLGITIGILSKNRQTATAIGTPIAIIIGFIPMIASFNESIERVANVLYSQQINVIVNDFSASLLRPLLVIAANITVFAVIFTIAYKKKGLKI